MAVGMIAGAVLSGASSLGRLIQGGIQTRRGRRDLARLEANRPIYERPDEVGQMGRISRLRASNPFMAGQALMEQNVAQTGASTVSNIQDMGGMSDLMGVQQTTNKAMNEIGFSAAQSRLQNELQLLQQLATEADYSDKEFDTNVYLPWQEKRQDALSRIGAGQKNLIGALDNFGVMGSSLLRAGGEDDSDTNPSSQSPSMSGGGGMTMASLANTGQIGMNSGSLLNQGGLWGNIQNRSIRRSSIIPTTMNVGGLNLDRRTYMRTRPSVTLSNVGRGLYDEMFNLSR